MRVAPVHGFESWRAQARALLHAGAAPEEVAWQGKDEIPLAAAEDHPVSSHEVAAPRIPRKLLALLEACACHNAPDRWALMYRVLWRATRGGEPHLLDDPADPDVRKVQLMARGVEREVHRMHAFVRFRELREPSGEILYAAWFEPEHDVLQRAAPFFVERFAAMRWVIATPYGAARWNGERLEFSEDGAAVIEPDEDPTAGLWRTYYESTFNPARLNVRLMQKDMPRRYWRDLPELRDVDRLVSQAGPRLAVFRETQAIPPRWARHAGEQLPAPEDEGASLESALQSCRRCPLWERATQAVGGRGPQPAPLMVVGEQPGDEEDLRGEPFVGPAGRVLERAFAASGLARDQVWLTNAVKHFKWEPRGKRRMHKTPAQLEIAACSTWLERELEEVRPHAILALGASAAYALLRERQPIHALRDKRLMHPNGTRVLVTYHPSAVLRADDQADRLFEALCGDLRAAWQLATELSLR